MRSQLRILGSGCLRVALLCAAASAHAGAPPSKPFTLPQIPGLPAPDAIRQKVTEAAISRVLDNELPVRLDATSIYPTVAAPPGGPFHPQPLALSPEDLNRPLPPGDYALPMLAFCMEYSVHRPGAGTAYVLGPLQGKAAQAIGALLWRGTVALSMPPQQLQSVSWAIQSGLTYSQMPQSFQAVIDRVIPDYKSQLNGNFLQQVQNTYQTAARGTGLPPLEKLLGGMGQPGQMALSSMKQQQILLRQNTSDQLREQTLFRGQESGVYTPVRAEEGPWTERIPGVAYVRFKIVGGNLASNNVLEVRILPMRGSRTAHNANGGFVPVGYSPLLQSLVQAQAQATPTLPDVAAGACGYAVSKGAQVLCPVPVTDYPSCKCGDPTIPGMPKQNFDGASPITNITQQSPQQSSAGNVQRTPYQGVPLNSAVGPTGTGTMVVFPDYCEGNTIDGIMFAPMPLRVLKPTGGAAACSAGDMHIRQFVSTTCQGSAAECDTYYVSSCRTKRNFGQWYLDECDGTGYYTPDTVLANGVHVINDEPNVNIPPGSPTGVPGTPLTKSFYDVLMCGNTPVYAFSWQRTGQPNPQWCKAVNGGLKNVTTNSYSNLKHVAVDDAGLKDVLCKVQNPTLTALQSAVRCP